MLDQKLLDLYETPLLKLITDAQKVHQTHHKTGEVQVCHLISIKTGGCPENCKYCSQSSQYASNVKAEPMMRYEEVIARAKEALKEGITRVCLGAAWRGVRNNKQFDEVLKMVKEISSLGLEVCCTLGLLNEEQATKLRDAGLYAYNHNLDSSEEFYPTFVSTRSYQDRLDTLDAVEKAGLSICCGGIIGMGESIKDRLNLLQTLSKRNPQPESVPINLLSPIEGTPFENLEPPSFWEYLRLIAVARILMPKSMIRLSAGRQFLTITEQALCFLAGANSIHAGEKLLTIQNTPKSQDDEMFQVLGLTKREAYANKP